MMAIRYDVEQKCANPLTLLVGKTNDSPAISCTDRAKERMERLVRDNWPLLQKLCRNQFTCDEDAEDLSGNVLLAIFKRFNTFDPDKGKFNSWLGAIVRNEAADMRRKMERLPNCVPSCASTEFILESIEAKVYEPEEEPEAVVELPPLLRQVMNLTKIDGLTSAEAAKVLKLTEGSVRTYIWRARRMMKEATTLI